MHLSKLLLPEREREREPDDLKVDIFKLRSTYGDDDNEYLCFLRLSRDSTELVRCHQLFPSCLLRRNRLTLNASSEVVPVEAGGKRSDDDSISFVTGGSRLSSFQAVLIMHYFTKTMTVAIKPRQLTIFSISVCINVSNSEQLLNLWLRFLSRTSQ